MPAGSFLKQVNPIVVKQQEKTKSKLLPDIPKPNPTPRNETNISRDSYIIPQLTIQPAKEDNLNTISENKQFSLKKYKTPSLMN